jgi:DNA polymerase I
MKLSSMFPPAKTLAPSGSSLKELSKSATASMAAKTTPDGKLIKVRPGEFKVEWPKMPRQQPKDYRPITKAQELIEYAQKCEVTGYASFDYETAPDDQEREWYASEKAHYEGDRMATFLELQSEESKTKPEKAKIKELKAELAMLDANFEDVKKSFQSSPLDPHRSKVCTTSISAAPHEARVIFIDHKAGRLLFEPELSRDEARKLFFDILDRYYFANPKIMKIAYNLEFETKQSARYGKYINMPVADPFIMLIRCLQIVAPTKVQADERAYTGKGLKAVTKEYLGVQMTEFKKVLGKQEVEFFDELSTDDPEALKYSAEDSDYGLQQYLYWVEIAKQIPKYYEWLHNIEMPFMRVLGLMEYHGMGWNKDLAQQKREEAENAQVSLQEEIKQLAKNTFGIDVNPGAAGKTGDVRSLIFDYLKLPAASWGKPGRNGDRSPSLDKEALLDMIFMLENKLISLDEEEYLAVQLPEDWESRDPETDRYLSKDERQAIRIKRRDPHPYKEEGIQLLKILQKIQKYATLLSSHIDGREKYIHPRTGRIHHRYGVWTETSRCNCFQPNGQNVPRSDHDELGVRSMYKAEPGKVFFLIDFSGFELRIMSWKANEQTMQHIFNTGGDMHRKTASVANGVPEEEVTKHMRYSAKPANFGICYGGTEYALQTTVKVELDLRWSLPECAKLVNAVKEAYPGIPKYQRDIVLEAREKGYVETIYGFKRLLLNINSASQYLRGSDERRAGNTPIQGSAADIMKRAQNAVYDKVGMDSRLYFERLDNGRSEEDALKGLILVHGHNDMCGQIHDEMIFQMDDNVERIKTAANWVKAKMEEKPVEDFPVPVIAEAAVGYDWGHKIDYDKWLKNLEGGAA